MSQPKARLDTLRAYAATDGRKLIEKRIKSLLKQARLQCGHAGETVGIVDQLRSRLATARLAVKADNGFAAAQLIMEAEQLVGAINAVLAAPLVKAATGSAAGRVKSRPAIRATQEEKRAAKDIELKRLLLEDKNNKSFARQRSDYAIANRLAPLYAEWAKKVGEKPLTAGTIRKWLADAN